MIDTQPNERRCATMTETHILDLPECCPVSKNPRPGSTIEITYTPGRCYLEVASLKKYIGTYRGGRGEVRSMEGMIQAIAQDCANAVGRRVDVEAKLNLVPEQRMILRCLAEPQKHVNHERSKAEKQLFDGHR